MKSSKTTKLRTAPAEDIKIDDGQLSTATVSELLQLIHQLKTLNFVLTETSKGYAADLEAVEEELAEVKQEKTKLIEQVAHLTKLNAALVAGQPTTSQGKKSPVNAEPTNLQRLSTFKAPAAKSLQTQQPSGNLDFKK